MGDNDKQKMSADRARSGKAALSRKPGALAEKVDSIENRLNLPPDTANSQDNDELAKIKKQLADTKKELAKEKKLTANNKGNFSIIAPNKLLDGMPSVDYPFKVFIETMDFIKRNTDGSKNIIFNYLIIRGLEVAKKDLISNDIVLDTGGKVQDS